MFESLKEKRRLAAELESAQQTLAAQAQEIDRLREAIKVRTDCIKELCGCLDDAAPWIDPLMVGPVTQAGEAARLRLLERVDAALIWAGHRKAPP